MKQVKELKLMLVPWQHHGGRHELATMPSCRAGSKDPSLALNRIWTLLFPHQQVVDLTLRYLTIDVLVPRVTSPLPTTTTSEQVFTMSSTDADASRGFDLPIRPGHGLSQERKTSIENALRKYRERVLEINMATLETDISDLETRELDPMEFFPGTPSLSPEELPKRRIE